MGQVGGTWTDDSSMTFCTMESLCRGYDFKDIGNEFYKWLYKSEWTPHEIVFDVGMTTSKAIRQIRKGNYSGCGDVNECGNGALMRIMPIVFWVDKNRDDKFNIIREVASLTHSHIRSVIGCAIYVELSLNLLNGQDVKSAYRNMQKSIISEYEHNYKDELMFFRNIVYDDVSVINPKRLNGKGYIVSTLECSLYSFMTSSSYSEYVLKAIGFGEDTDTVAAEGLAGLYWGYNNIPSRWINKLVKKDEIFKLCDKFENSLKDKK